jgi:hypothetical protein
MTIIAITGRGLPGDVDEVRDAGFDHVLAKPIGFDALRALVDEIQPSASIPLPGPAGMTLLSLAERIAAADEACALGDAGAFGDALLPMVALAPVDVAVDLIGVLAVSRFDLELAGARWSQLRNQLR